jgi:hypothetical protein
MAGIEKICEFSDRYPDHPTLGGWIMRRWKRNHIQIMPEYRPLFRGCDHFFRIVGFEIQEWSKGCYSKPCAWEAGNYNSARQYIDEQKKQGRHMRIQYEYVLEVFDPELQGTVEGKYREWSFDLKAVIRKMRRMVGPGLIVVNELEGSRGKIMRKWRAEFQKKRDEILERELAEEREAEERIEQRLEEQNAP